MIDKKEVIKDIRTLLDGVVEPGTKIGISWQNPNFADIFLDGEYFNTYMVEKRKFLRNVRKDSEESGVVASIVISRDDLREKYEGYEGAQLQLPASASELRDALLRARITDEGQTYTVTEFTLFGEDISDTMVPEQNMLQKLNYLVRRLNGFEEETQKIFMGFVKNKGIQNMSIPDMINLTYNLDNCVVYYGVESDEELGRFYADNEMIEWLKDASGEVRKYLDYRLLGNDIREKEEGAYIDEGYIVNKTEEFQTIYDGTTFPENYDAKDYYFRVSLINAESGSNGKRIWLDLPTSEDEKKQVLSLLGTDTFENCYMNSIESPEPKIPMCVSDISQLDILNKLSCEMNGFEGTGNLAKFRAILEAMPCQDLDEIVKYTECLDEFVLYHELSDTAEYAKAMLGETYKGVLPDTVMKCIDFKAYAEELLKTEEIYVTEYGVLKRKAAKTE